MRPGVAPTAVRGLLCGFVACVAVAQIAEPERGPLRHQLSELVHGNAGWVMDVGLACWAIALGLAATTVLAHPARSDRAIAPGVAVLVGVAAIGVVVLALFPTQTVAGELPRGVARTTSGRLHDLGSGLVTAALAAAAIASGTAARRADRRFAMWVAVLLGVAALATVIGLLIGPSVGGVRQRAVVACALAWLWLLVGGVRRAASP
ncbi:MAG TPA: DUF998 domain-containing protein [Baekduia sp.]|uniref:DUF998 domain-containing protein n=1 Tax=Baekduia sp. TaxID=2600305 RepID=UPI002D78B8AC|nr:DUF998 domain-containing protein [Baekduia sp.]HET6509754.1 DUF998 domain-containing protein [Baekduia sp.]